MNADHRSMVRFSPNEPEKYRPLKNALKGIVNKMEAGTFSRLRSYFICADRHLDSLHDPKALEYPQKLHCIDYENLLTESVQPYPGTGTWLFENPSFRAWAKEPLSGVCLVRGNAGFGKTVIAQSIVENCKLRTDRAVDLALWYFRCFALYFPERQA